MPPRFAMSAGLPYRSARRNHFGQSHACLSALRTARQLDAGNPLEEVAHRFNYHSHVSASPARTSCFRRHPMIRAMSSIERAEAASNGLWTKRNGNAFLKNSAGRFPLRLRHWRNPRDQRLRVDCRPLKKNRRWRHRRRTHSRRKPAREAGQRSVETSIQFTSQLPDIKA
jgi:hypothetical protein